MQAAILQQQQRSDDRFAQMAQQQIESQARILETVHTLVAELRADTQRQIASLQ